MAYPVKRKKEKVPLFTMTDPLLVRFTKI